MKSLRPDTEEIDFINNPNHVVVCDKKMFISKQGIEFPYYKTGLIPIENFKHYLFQEKNSYSHHLFFSEKDQIALLTNRRNELVFKIMNHLVPLERTFEVLEREETEASVYGYTGHYLKLSLTDGNTLMYPIGILTQDSVRLGKEDHLILEVELRHGRGVINTFYNKKFEEIQLIKLNDFEKDYSTNENLSSLRVNQEKKHKKDGRITCLVILVLLGLFLLGFLNAIFWYEGN